MDISVTAYRLKGERRGVKKGINRNPNWVYPKSFNPFLVALNHQKHIGKIYREAIGGFEIKGKPRFQVDAYEY